MTRSSRAWKSPPVVLGWAPAAGQRRWAVLGTSAPRSWPPSVRAVHSACHFGVQISQAAAQQVYGRDQPTHAGRWFRGRCRFLRPPRRGGVGGRGSGWLISTRARSTAFRARLSLRPARASSNSHGPTQSIMNAHHGGTKLDSAESQCAGLVGDHNR